MIYRKLGNTGVNISALGFGSMRLPMIEKDNKKIVDEDKAIAMIRRGFDLGINYIDTALVYCENLSENAVGKAIKGYRDNIYLSTKCPMWACDTTDYYRRTLETQLRKLDVEYIDFYHFHAVDRNAFVDKIMGLNLVKEAMKAKEEGLIKHISFSFHDKPEVMREIIDTTGIMETVLCQYNMIDTRNEPAMKYAKEQGLGVVVMGPIGGGNLVEPSDVFSDISNQKLTTVDLALKFVLSNPDVDCTLSGMENMKMVEENVKYVASHTPLNNEEKQKVIALLENIGQLANLYCTGCNYCMPCPKGIKISTVFNIMNLHKVYKLTKVAYSRYKSLGEQEWMGAHPNNCVECGKCESKCPQKIQIIKQLKEVINEFENIDKRVLK